MSSSLRYSTTPVSASVPITRRQSIASPPAKKQKMSLTQTYMLATVARRQLQKEAARADHDLRLLVGHANLLDGLMLDLANAEQEQESWFNQSVSHAASSEPKHVQWAEGNSIPEEAVEDEEYYDEDSDDDESEDEAVSLAQKAVRTRLPTINTTEVADDEDQEMDDDFTEELSLTRSPSHSASSPSSSTSSAPSSPPELFHEFDSSDSESEDESLPSSPELSALDAFSQHQLQRTLQPSKVSSSKAAPTELDLSLFDHETQQPIPIAAC